ncbi:MAG: ATP-dependent DNA helicase RecG [Proteobacteria bacterium]|nr:ATP-dependent DNA helicase RecG [Pseudomonadota bacterium]
MRPEILFPLFGDVDKLSGVGPRIRQGLERLAGTRVVDLLWHLPVGLVDRGWEPDVADVVDGRVATLTVTVGKHQKPPNRRVPYRIPCADDSGKITLIFFHGVPKYLKEQLPEDETRIISGRVEFYDGKPQMTHPDYILKPDEKNSLPAVEPVYPLTQGVTNKTLVRAIQGALERAPDLPEWLDEAYLKVQKWPGWRAAITAAHNPASTNALAPDDPARARLAYDELLANQLALALVRHHARKRKGRAIEATGETRARVLAALPYQLTASQETTLAEIDADMRAPDAMLRLIQGDVGSGKTIVAFLAMISAVEAGAQAALLAPTEILARQHFAGLSVLGEAAGVKIELLTGRNKGKGREAMLQRLKAGEIDMLIGTHALIQEDVAFADLALAVIDEQHRFGVYQRLALAGKGSPAPDVLVMTATPIPRTLTLTIYGDMEVSRITEKPPGRQPIETRVISLSRLGEVVESIARAVDAGKRAYWVCPLVEESEVIDLAAAEARHQALKERLGKKVGLVHGRMKAADKDAAMAAFVAGETQVLVATTVIEVGVDVPEASIMIIEHAERFGLAQLHQLRGRVGRGPEKSSCLLLRADEMGQAARARLQVMRETEDGFLIAEEDLRLRGAGELLGTRQSGFPQFRVADIAEHGELLATAGDDARLVMARDPDLNGERGEKLRALLYLFERDSAVGYLKSG